MRWLTTAEECFPILQQRQVYQLVTQTLLGGRIADGTPHLRLSSVHSVAMNSRAILLTVVDSRDAHWQYDDCYGPPYFWMVVAGSRRPVHRMLPSKVSVVGKVSGRCLS